MKKIIICMVYVFCSLLTFGGWTTTEHKKDELTGEGGYTSYGCENKSGMVVLYSNGGIKLISGKYSFFSHQRDENFECSYVKYSIADIGIYNENEKLVKRGKLYMSISDEGSSYAYIKDPDYVYYSIDKQIFINQVYNALCNTGWKVRIVAPRYATSNFDVTLKSDDLFKSLSWIPANKERIKKEKIRENEEQQRLMEINENARLKKEKEDNDKKKLARIKELEETIEELEKTIVRLEKGGYNFVAKKKKNELKELKNELENCKNELNNKE